jgi:translation initiation factor IF-1
MATLHRKASPAQRRTARQDRVKMKMTRYDLGKARIVYRLTSPLPA